MLTIIASMEREITGLRQELRTGRTDAGPALRCDSGPALDLQVVGVGKRSGANLRSIIEERLDSPGTADPASMRILLLGFAGAVSPGLEIGDLVLSPRYYRNEGPATADPPNGFQPEKVGPPDYLSPDPSSWEHAMAAAARMERPAAQVTSLTVGELVTTPRMKESIRERYQVAVVDMEDYWAASAAREFGIPFLSARAVLDRADQGLPGYLPGMVSSNLMTVLSTAAKPWRIPTLLDLARRLPVAQRTLTTFALHFYDQWTQTFTGADRPAEDSKALIGTGRSALE